MWIKLTFEEKKPGAVEEHETKKTQELESNGKPANAVSQDCSQNKPFANLANTEPQVFKVCDHFLAHNIYKPPNSCSKVAKVCSSRCETKKAFWNRSNSRWIVVRPRPKEVYGDFQLCKHYMASRPCFKTPCTFAHGEVERRVWTEEREAGKSGRIIFVLVLLVCVYCF